MPTFLLLKPSNWICKWAKKHAPHLFVKMPLRESAEKPEFPRTSPRFLLQSTPPELQFSSGDPLPKNGEAKGNPDFPLGFIPRVAPKSFRRSPRFLLRIARPEPQDPKGNPKPIYKNSEGKGDPGFSPGFTPNVSRKKMHEVSRKKVSRNSGNSNDGLGNSANSGTGLRKCDRLSRGAAEIQCLRRSPRFLDRQKIEEERMKKIINKNDGNSKKCGVTRRVPSESVVPKMVLRSSSRLGGGSRNCPKSSTELRKSPRVIDAGIHSLRRFLRFSNVRKTNECVKATDRVENNNCFTKPVSYRKSVDHEKASKILHKLNDGSRKCATSCDGLRKSSARNVASRIKSLGNSARSTDMGKNGEGLEKIRNSASFCVEFPLGIGGSLRSRVDSIGVERKDGKATNVDEGNKRINGIGTKRKRQEAREKRALARGWTQEQELALQNAYIAAKSTTHFWKKVAKLVPGKSAQDCFNKIHSDHVTPTQRPPRSRAKKSEASTLSASKLLKSTGLRKKVRYDKRKSHITQKHCIGSVPTESKKLDRPVSMAEVYKVTRMKKDGTMIDKFSQYVMDTYTQIPREQRCKCRMSNRQFGVCSASAPKGRGMGEEGDEGQEEEEGEPTETSDDHRESITGADKGQFELDAWLESTGRPNKSRVIGFGLRVHSSTILGSSASVSARESQYASSGPPPPSPTFDELQRQLEESMREQREQAVSFSREMAEMRRLIADLTRGMVRPDPPADPSLFPHDP